MGEKTMTREDLIAVAKELAPVGVWLDGEGYSLQDDQGQHRGYFALDCSGEGDFEVWNAEARKRAHFCANASAAVVELAEENERLRRAVEIEAANLSADASAWRCRRPRYEAEAQSAGYQRRADALRAALAETESAELNPDRETQLRYYVDDFGQRLESLAQSGSIDSHAYAALISILVSLRGLTKKEPSGV